MDDLQLYNQLAVGSAYERDLSTIALDWKRTVGAQGGFLLGDFTVATDTVALSYLLDFYNVAMGKRIVERTSGVTTWEGEIAQMDLTLDGIKYRRTLASDRFNNRIQVRYGPDLKTDVTAFVEDTDSSGQYGVSTLIDIVQSGYDATSAAARRDRLLNERAFPRSHAIDGFVVDGTSRTGDNQLYVLAAGYAFSMNRKYQTTDLAAGNLSAHISTLVGNSEFVTAGAILPNTLQVEVNVSQMPGRLWDEVRELVDMGDTSGVRYIGGVYGGRVFEYKAAETAITHYWRDGRLFDATGHLMRPALVLPDIIVQVASSVSLATMGAGDVWDNPRNVYIDAVEFIAPNSYRLIPRTS